MLNPAQDSGFIAFTGTACGLLPTPAEPVRQAADMIPVIANPEAPPKQIGDALRGPHGGREAVRFGVPRQQARELSQLPVCQLRGTAGPLAAAQPGCSAAAILPRPWMNRLTAHPELPGNPGQRLAALDARQGRETACLEHSCISSHDSKVRQPIECQFIYADILNHHSQLNM